MKQCTVCQANIGGSLNRCPFCGTIIHMHNAGTPNGYPEYGRHNRRRYRMNNYRSWTTLALIMASVVIGTVNICVGGRAWSLYVITAIFIYYQIFLSRRLVESSLIRKLLSVITSTCVLLTLIQAISRPEMRAVQIIIPILLYSSLFVSAFLYFVNFKSQKSHVMPIIYSILLAIAGVAVGASIFRVMSWPIIVLISLIVFLIAFSILFYRESIRSELRKKLHS